MLRRYFLSRVRRKGRLFKKLLLFLLISC